MAISTHKYFCKHCKVYLFGETVERLALSLNAHNTHIHPFDYRSWTASDIVISHSYSGPSDPPAYLVSYVRTSGATFSKEWGDAKPPEITEYDKTMLAKGGVRW